MFSKCFRGHLEQLNCLKPLLGTIRGWFCVMERTQFSENADYFVTQTGFRDPGWIKDSIRLFFEVRRIWKCERPDVVISTGTYIALPFMIMCFIEKSLFILKHLLA